MKEKKYEYLITFLMISLNIFIAMGVVALLVFIMGFLSMVTSDGIKFKDFLNNLLFWIGDSSLIIILYSLRKILKTVEKRTPFIMSNVKNMKKIANCCFIIAGTYVVNFFYNQQYKHFVMIGLDNTGIHTDTEFLIFLFAGFIVLVLAQVYKQAIEVKEENDYTV